MSAAMDVVTPAAEALLDECAELGLDVTLTGASDAAVEVTGPSGEPIVVDLAPSAHSMVEQLLSQVTFDFASLPLLVRGDSKEIRLLTDKVTLARLLPTVYSYTNNRYGEIAGTEAVRARFSAEVFRAMSCRPGPRHLASAFLGLVEAPEGPLLAERRVETCNLEVRVKRFHVGSPVHRYVYTDRHPTAHGGPPLERWDRFERPLVCFDWRHPLTDDEGRRLADEPLPDDYAAVWIDDVERAKRLARDTFEWLEARFAGAGLLLIDICFFVDRYGRVVFGEISPDCMRVRSSASDDADALDKDEWRSGGDPATVLARYERLYDLVFGRASSGPRGEDDR